MNKKEYVTNIDGQVCLVHLSVCKRITSVCFFVNKRINYKLLFTHDEQMVYGLRKIAWASIFHLKRQHIYIYIYPYINIICSSVCFSTFHLQSQYGPGSRAERPIPSSALRGVGDGDPPCVLASGRWGPIYIAVHTQRMDLLATSWSHYGY